MTGEMARDDEAHTLERVVKHGAPETRDLYICCVYRYWRQEEEVAGQVSQEAR